MNFQVGSVMMIKHKSLGGIAGKVSSGIFFPHLGRSSRNINSDINFLECKSF